MLKKLINVVKSLFKKKGLSSIILFVTNKCNLRCQNCFNWMNLNRGADLSLDELIKTSASLPEFNFLLLSGGEPFMRDDLVEIIRTFRVNNKIKAVGIPTNGTMTSRVLSITKELLKIDTDFMVFVYFSIDGTAVFHDRSRDNAGSFDKATASLSALNDLRKTHSNLSISINSVISGYNLSEIPKLIDFVKKQGPKYVDMHYFEIVRGSARDPSVKNLDAAELRSLYEKVILPYQEQLFRERNGSRFLNTFLSRLATAGLLYEDRAQYYNFIEKRPWDMPCLAGKSIFVISSNGDVSACELRSPVANLHDAGFDLNRIADSDEWHAELDKICEDRCFCTHNCFLTGSMYGSKTVVLFKLPLLMLQTFLRGYKL